MSLWAEKHKNFRKQGIFYCLLFIVFPQVVENQ